MNPPVHGRGASQEPRANLSVTHVADFQSAPASRFRWMACICDPWPPKRTGIFVGCFLPDAVLAYPPSSNYPVTPRRCWSQCIRQSPLPPMLIVGQHSLIWRQCSEK